MPIVSLLIYMVVAVIVFSFMYWLVHQIPDPTVQKYASMVLIAIGVIVVVYILLSFTGASGNVILPRVRH